MDFQHKVPTVAYWTEDDTEVETEGVAYVVTAKSLIAWAHTILERTANLVVLVGLRNLDQLGFVQAQVIWNDLTPPWLRRLVRGLVAENWLQLSKTWMKNESKPLSNEFLKPHVLQPQTLSAKLPNWQNSQIKERNGKTKTTRQTTGDRCIQIVATVHFDPKLLSREILERFEVLFRPNIAKITKAVLIRLKD